MSAREWKDETSYSRGDANREPRTLSHYFNGWRLSVTRKHYHPGVWYLVCHDINIEEPLANAAIEEAKAEAVAIVRNKLTQQLKALK